MFNDFDVNNWLKYTSKDDSSFGQFVINYISESTAPTDEIKSGLASMMMSAWTDPELIANICDKIGWPETKKFLSETVPSSKTAKRGEFGEALTYEILEKMIGFKVLVKKLRYKVTSGQSLPGTDILAVKLVKGSITEVCFIECKLRTVHDNQAAVDAYNQLLGICKQRYSDIVKFTASRLKDSKDSLFETFKEYMLNNSNQSQIETFRVSLIYDKSAWNIKVIEPLRNESVKTLLGNTYVDVVSIKELKDLIDSVFESIDTKEVMGN